ncbi:hypothetical protein ACF0H5_020892 [Mactra antiquata]
MTAKIKSLLKTVVVNKEVRKSFYRSEAIHISLSLICIVMIIIMCLKIRDEKSKPKVEILKELSVLCEDLSLSLEEDSVTFDLKNKLYKQDVIELEYVCSTDNITDLIYKFVQRVLRVNLAEGRDTRKRYLSCGNSTLAPKSGYLSAILSRISSKTVQDAHKDGIVYWDSTHESSFIWPTFGTNNGGITISDSMNYFVFVTIMFIVGNESHYLTTASYVYVSVSVERYGYETIILQTSEQIDGGNKESATASLHIGSNVQLREGDTVRVRVSDPRRLVINSRGNAFGLMPMD